MLPECVCLCVRVRVCVCVNSVSSTDHDSGMKRHPTVSVKQESSQHSDPGASRLKEGGEERGREEGREDGREGGRGGENGSRVKDK